jgi:putative serine protease PepD
VAQQIIATGKVTRPYLGIEYRMTPLQGQDGWGAEVTNVVSGGPAEKSGVRQGDVIVALDGERFAEESPLVNRLMKHQVGDSVSLLVQRDGREQTLQVVLGSRPAS